MDSLQEPVLLLRADLEASFNTADFDSKVLKGSDYLKSLETTAVVNDYDWSAENPVSFDYFIGPNLYPLLSSIDKKAETDEDLSLTRLIPLGWSLFRWINTGVIIPIFNLLGLGSPTTAS